MELNEVRRVEFLLAPAVGTATLSSPEVTSERLTIGSPSISGKSVRATVTATTIGQHVIKCEAVTSSGETVIGTVRVVVRDSYNCIGTADYDR